MSALAEASSIASSTVWLSGGRDANTTREPNRILIAAATKGDAAASGGLVDLYQQRVFRTANTLLGLDWLRMSKPRKPPMARPIWIESRQYLQPVRRCDGKVKAE